MGVFEEIEALRLKGMRHLDMGEFEEAERIFKKLVKMNPSPVFRNNLAMCRFRQGDPEGALMVLKPNLEADLPNPFAHALAAQALAALGRRGDAEDHLAKAISDFETGLETVAPEGLVNRWSWREYEDGSSHPEPQDFGSAPRGDGRDSGGSKASPRRGKDRRGDRDTAAPYRTR